MGEIQTWRDLLKITVSDPQERQRIAHAIGINQVTLTRWITGTSSPRIRSLRILLDVLPEKRDMFLSLLAQDYPGLLQDDIQDEEELLQIPAHFYARVMEIYTHTPPFMRNSALGSIILQQILTQLDPQQAGLGIVITQCMPPFSGKVRSLRTILAQGSGLWQIIESSTNLYGIASQTGHAVQEQRLIVTHTSEVKVMWYPPYIANAQSVLTLPIQIADNVAGGIGLLSVQTNFFTAEKIDLLRAYAELLVLIFEPDEFYPSSQIELGVIPPSITQKPLLTNFQQRVKQLLVEATSKQILLTPPHAEMEVWKEIESTLLYSLNTKGKNT